MRKVVVREIMIGVGATLAVGVIAVGVISALIVEKTPSLASAGAFPCDSPAVIAAAEKAIGIKRGPPDDLNLRNARDVRYDEAHDVMFCRVDLFRGSVIVNDYKYPVGFTFMAKAPSGLLSSLRSRSPRFTRRAGDSDGQNQDARTMPAGGEVARRYSLDIQADRRAPDVSAHVRHLPTNRAIEAVIEGCDIADVHLAGRHEASS